MAGFAQPRARSHLDLEGATVQATISVGVPCAIRGSLGLVGLVRSRTQQTMDRLSRFLLDPSTPAWPGSRAIKVKTVKTDEAKAQDARENALGKLVTPLIVLLSRIRI